ncbi:MAG: hypothetical protein Q7U99_08010 [Rubrivivax sp.]|nr:hypothetical protein [Rubrivivax sp.]
MHHVNFARAVAGLALLGAAAGAPALAQTWLQATVVVDAKHYVVGIDDPFTDSDYLGIESATPFGPISALADSDHQPPVYHGLAIAWSQVGLGGVHVYAQAQSVASGPDLLRVTGSGQASGFMSDYFTLSVPGAASGASFTVTAQVHVDGSAWAETVPGWTAAYQPAGQLAAFSHWESWVRVLRGDSGTTLAELRAREDCDARTNTGSGPFCQPDGTPGLQVISFTMVNNGTPVQLDMRGWASAGTSIYQPTQLTTADSRADLGHTIAWGGITELRDASGALVTDFAAVSASSGFDYRNAYVSTVPDAPTSVLLLAGLAMLGTGWRRGLRRRA